MASIIYNDFWGDLMDKKLDMNSDTFNVQLHTATYSPDKDHGYGSLTNEVAEAGNYNTGGKSLASLTVTVDDTNDRGCWDAANVTWESSTITARYAVLKDVTNSNSLICCVDFGSTVSSSNGNFTIAWHANGIMTLAQA